ncbi:MAG TPA: DinB family protein [Blastocatellia bacterium]|nr:DinB family protein [Blastocatellia bacterium]
MDLIADYAAYNLWANKQLVDWLKTKPLEAMEREVPSSFSSVKQTLVHIWDTETWWLGTLQQSQPESNYGRVFSGPLEEVFAGLVAQSEALVAYAQLLTADSLQEQCPFSIPYFGDFVRPRFEMIQHTVNHSTYHRGQIVTIGRNVGLADAPMTDFMFYLLMAKQQNAV